MASEATTEHDDYTDSMTPLLVYDALRNRQVEPISAAIMTAGVLIADAVRSLKAAT